MDIDRIAKFALVGTVGFIVDAGLLQMLVTVFDWGPIAARVVSFPCAVGATWLLNRRYTFRASPSASALQSLTRYAAVSIAGAAVNFAVYAALVVGWDALAALPVIPLAVASIVALGVNYVGSKHFAFR